MVDEQAVVGHVVLQVRMRPVGAPQRPVGELLDDLACEGHHVPVGVALPAERGRSRDGQPLGAGHLHPHVVRLHEPQEAREFGSARAAGDVRAAHVVDDQRYRQGGEEGFQVRQVRRLEVEDDVPAQRRDPAGHRLQGLARGRIHQAPDEVETHCAYPGLVQPPQFGVGDVGADRRHAPGARTGRAQGVHQGAVVRAVAGGLHDDVAADAQVVAQGEQVVPGGVDGCVLPLGGEGELGGGAEDVAVGVDRSRRQDEGGCGRAAVPVEPAGGDRGVPVGHGGAPRSQST